MSATVKRRSIVGRSVRDLFRAAGFKTLREAEAATGVSRDTLRRVLSGRSADMTDANLEKIAAWALRDMGTTVTVRQMRGQA